MRTGLEGIIDDLEYRVKILENVLYTLVDFRAMSIYREDVLRFRENMEVRNADDK